MESKAFIIAGLGKIMGMKGKQMCASFKLSFENDFGLPIKLIFLNLDLACSGINTGGNYQGPDFCDLENDNGLQ